MVAPNPILVPMLPNCFIQELKNWGVWRWCWSKFFDLQMTFNLCNQLAVYKHCQSKRKMEFIWLGTESQHYSIKIKPNGQVKLQFEFTSCPRHRCMYALPDICMHTFKWTMIFKEDDQWYDKRPLDKISPHIWLTNMYWLPTWENYSVLMCTHSCVS